MRNTKLLLAAVLALTPAMSFAATGTTVTPTGVSASGVTVAAPASSLHEELNVPGAPVLVSQTATSVTLSWEKVDAATSYIVKYSKSSVAEAFNAGKTDATYEIETDPVTATGTTINGLKSGVTYYFAVVGVDKANNESPTNSEELAVTLSAATTTATGTTVATTATGTTASAFKVSKVNVIDSNRVEVVFGSSVSTETPVTLKLVKTSDSSNVATSSVAVDPLDTTKVIVSLATALDPSSSYVLTVISAKDTNGTPIQAGIDAVKEFATSANLKSAALGSMNAAPTATGATATGATATGTMAPTDAKALPATGTKENLLFALAAVLSLGIVLIARRKRA